MKKRSVLKNHLLESVLLVYHFLRVPRSGRKKQEKPLKQINYKEQNEYFLIVLFCLFFHAFLCLRLPLKNRSFCLRKKDFPVESSLQNYAVLYRLPFDLPVLPLPRFRLWLTPSVPLRGQGQPSDTGPAVATPFGVRICY